MGCPEFLARLRDECVAIEILGGVKDARSQPLGKKRKNRRPHWLHRYLTLVGFAAAYATSAKA